MSADRRGCQVMGILNVTPDSFSDGGSWVSVEAAVAEGRAMFEAGASIVDVGGESTRPGAVPVDADEELRRVVPVVEELSDYGTVSIDTRKESVARRCVRAGALIVNDVSASLGTVAAEHGVGCVAMHMRGDPTTMQDDPQYDDVTREVLAHLLPRAGAARRHGAPRVWIDPGIGFGKTTSQNITLLRQLDRFVQTGIPVLVGASRKNFIGDLGGEPNPRDRLGGSISVAVLAAELGVDVVRVHDVRQTVQALRVAAAVSAAAPTSSRPRSA